jgi:hypothetical protein
LWTLPLLSWNFDEDIIRLFCHVLTSFFFCLNGQFYKEMGDMAIGTPLTPVIGNFIVEDSETGVLNGQLPINPTAGSSTSMTHS